MTVFRGVVEKGSGRGQGNGENSKAMISDFLGDTERHESNLNKASNGGDWEVRREGFRPSNAPK